MKFRKYTIDFNKDIFWKNIKFALVGIIPIFFIGLLISFICVKLMPGDPVIALLQAQGISSPSPAMIAAMQHQLGLDLPIFMQFFRYLGDLFIGDWGHSVSVAPGILVWDLIASRLPKTIDLLLIPSLLGIIFGNLLGKVSNNYRKKWSGKLIHVLAGLGFAIPIFLFGMGMQYFLGHKMGIFPTSGYKQGMYDNPPYVTGFYAFDALLAREYFKISDYLWHLTMPMFILSILSIALLAWQKSTHMEKKASEKSFISNTTITAIIFSFMLMFVILIEFTFGIYGFGFTIVNAIEGNDYFVFNGVMYIIIIFVVIITFISNLFLCIFKSSTVSRLNPSENDPTHREHNEMDQAELNPTSNSETVSKKQLYYLFRSPLTIIGLILVGIIIILAIFPESISGFSLAEAKGSYIGPFSPPSSEHLLGTTESGRDVFALILYGIRDVLIFSFGAVIIGVVLSILIGILSSLHRISNILIGMISIGLIIIPVPIIIFIISKLFDNTFVQMLIMGLLLIPILTRIVAYVPLNKRNTSISFQKLVIYLPLVVGSVILIYTATGFIGLSSGFNGIQLGLLMANARLMLPIAPWASLWPGFFIFLSVMGLFLFFIGLKNTFLEQLDSHRLSENNILVE